MSGIGIETQAHADFLYALIQRAIAEALAGFVTSDGKLALRTGPIQGPLGTGGGGTGNNWGFKDHGHSGDDDGQQLAEANTHQSLVTDPATAIHWSREMLQDMIAGFLVDQHGDPFAYNDAGNLLTIETSEDTIFVPVSISTPDGPLVVFAGDDSVALIEVPRP